MKQSYKSSLRSHRVAMAVCVYVAAVVAFFVVRYSEAYAANRWIVALPTIVAAVFTLLHYRRGGIFVPLALVASAAGDLMGAQHLFIAQVAYFALAHIFYIVDFSRAASWRGHCPRVAALAVVTTGYLGLVLSHIGSAVEMAAVGVYGVIIFLMASCAVTQQRRHAVWYAVAALLFVVSDSMIVFNKYVGAVPYEDELVMTTYYAAQGLFAYLMLGREMSRD
ncbi:MAG: lysoplasmalogenase [Alistipes sp.]|nr:lysoplasmalogenase [Alistipes sp.]